MAACPLHIQSFPHYALCKKALRAHTHTYTHAHTVTPTYSHTTSRTVSFSHVPASSPVRHCQLVFRPALRGHCIRACWTRALCQIECGKITCLIGCQMSNANSIGCQILWNARWNVRCNVWIYICQIECHMECQIKSHTDWQIWCQIVVTWQTVSQIICQIEG